MKLISDDDASSWLEDLDSEGESFEWDTGNRGKNLKHGASDGMIESLLQAPFYFAGRIVEPDRGEWRGLLLGKDSSGRGWALVFTRREDRLRPISCRPMRDKEKAIYEERREGHA